MTFKRWLLELSMFNMILSYVIFFTNVLAIFRDLINRVFKKYL